LLAADYPAVESFVSRPQRIEIYAASRQAQPQCPRCGGPSPRVQSRYERTLNDLHWHGVIIAVEGDPLANLGVLQQVKFVMRDGGVIKHLEKTRPRKNVNSRSGCENEG
jgi:hypothetical protein